MLIVFGITGEHGHCGIPDDCESLPHEAQAFDVSFAGQIALQLPFVSSHFAGFSSHFAGKQTQLGISLLSFDHIEFGCLRSCSRCWF